MRSLPPTIYFFVALHIVADIGYWNVSAYNQGMMGYKTPNIDRIEKEGALFNGEIILRSLHCLWVKIEILKPKNAKRQQ